MSSDRMFFSLSPDPALILDRDGRILQANPAAVRVLGRVPDPLSVPLLADYCHPEDRTRLAGLAHSVPTEAVRFEPLRFCTQDETRWIEWHLSPMEGGDQLLAIGRDLTDQIVEQLTLRKRLAQLSDAERIAGIGSLHWDANTDQRYWSDGLYHLFGLAPQSASPSLDTLSRHLPPQSMQRVKLAIEKAQSGNPADLQYPIVRACGAERELHVRLEPTIDSEGRVTGYNGTALDITERQAVLTALADSEYIYRALMEHASDATLVVNSEGRFVDANHRAAELLGYTKEELLQMGPPDVHPPEEQERVRDAFRQMKETGQSLYEHRVRAKDGRILPVEVAGTRIACGEGQIYLGSFRDLTQRKKNESDLWRKSEELEAMFANLHVSIAVLDREFNFLRVNASYSKANGVPPEAFVGHNHFSLFPHPENENLFRQVVATSEPISVIAKRFDHPALGPTYWDWMLTPFNDAEGRVEGLVLALIDVTERELRRQAAEETWQQAQTELEQRVSDRTAELKAANRELEAFSYSVSHDLMAPLRAINGFSQALVEDFGTVLGHQGDFLLNRIQGATLRMRGMIDGLLSLSQVFRKELQTKEVNLTELAHDIICDLRDSDPERRVEFNIEPDLTTFGDDTLLRLLLQNLLGNAWKFTTRQQQPRIRLGRAHLAGRDLFVVSDNGVGFEPEYAHKLFQPFERLHSESEFMGTGIGLATVRRIVHRHGGEVWAEGSPDEGAAVFFALASIRPDSVSMKAEPTDILKVVPQQ